MKDLHTHILSDIDDGSDSKEESIEIIKKAYNNGVTDIVLTPHYIHNTIYNANNKIKEDLLQELKHEMNNEGININLYLGNEVYLDEVISFIDLNRDISTINNSRYILVELPLYTESSSIEDSINYLIEKKLVPIIAHPERYLAYYGDYTFFDNLVKMGCLLQGNIGSIYGLYGRKSKKMIRYMLKKNMIHFLASDVHYHNSDIYLKQIERDLLKIIKDKQVVEDLLINNVNKVLNNIFINSNEWSRL